MALLAVRLAYTALNMPMPIMHFQEGVEYATMKLQNYLSANPWFGKHHMGLEGEGKHLEKGFITLGFSFLRI